MGDVAAAARLGADVARRRARHASTRRRPSRSHSRSRATSSPATSRLLTVGVWVVARSEPGFVKRVGRAALVAAGGLLVAAWVLVPLVGDTKWTTQSEYYKGIDLQRLVRRAARSSAGSSPGSSSTTGRFPVFTILFFVGAIACALARPRRPARAGDPRRLRAEPRCSSSGARRSGRSLNVLPGFDDIQIHRFVMGVDLAGDPDRAVWRSGGSSGWRGRLATRLRSRAAPALVARRRSRSSLALVVLAPAWAERGHYDLRGGDLIQGQQRAPTRPTAPTSTSSSRSSRRAATAASTPGCASNWGTPTRSASVPVYAWLAGPLGRRDRLHLPHDRVTVDRRRGGVRRDEPRAVPDVQRPLPHPPRRARPPTVPAKLIASSGRHRLYEVETTGYFQVVDRAAPIAANRTNVEQATKAWRTSDLASQNIYPGDRVRRRHRPRRRRSAAPTPPAGSPGTVLSQAATLDDGDFTATVQARPVARSCCSRRRSTRAGRSPSTALDAKPVMMAPSLVGVDVPAGHHVVRFKYRSYSDYPLLFLIGALAVLALVAIERRWIAQAFSGARRYPA